MTTAATNGAKSLTRQLMCLLLYGRQKTEPIKKLL